jgi:hypothetical protein
MSVNGTIIGERLATTDFFQGVHSHLSFTWAIQPAHFKPRMKSINFEQQKKTSYKVQKSSWIMA